MLASRIYNLILKDNDIANICNSDELYLLFKKLNFDVFGESVYEVSSAFISAVNRFNSTQ